MSSSPPPSATQAGASTRPCSGCWRTTRRSAT
jgi:hypothetical protein